MCSFATRNATDFSLTMLRFVSATAGLVEPRPPAPFNLDACWTMVDPLNGHERVAAVSK